MGFDTDIAVTTTSRRWPGWHVAWIVVVALFGFVQVLRAEWFDAAVLFVVSVLLCIDVVLSVSRYSSGASRTFALQPSMLRSRWVWIAAAVVGIAASLLPRQSLAMQVLICAAGVTVLVAGWMQGHDSNSRWPDGLRRLAWVWGVLIALGCVWEISQFIIGLLRPEVPAYALSNLLNPFISTWQGQAMFALLWFAFGAFLLRRGRY